MMIMYCTKNVTYRFVWETREDNKTIVQGTASLPGTCINNLSKDLIFYLKV